MMKIIAAILLVPTFVFAEADGDPYRYKGKDAKSKDYFFKLLPIAAQEKIKRNFPNFDYITSCKGRFTGANADEFAVNILEGGKKKSNHFFVVVMNGSRADFFSIDFSKQVTLGELEDDFMETHCDQGNEFGGQKLNGLKKKQAYIAIKPLHWDGLFIYAYDKGLKKYRYFDTVSPP